MMRTTEQRIRAHIAVREDTIRKTQPKIKTVSTEPADKMSEDSTPTHKSEETSALTKVNSTKRNGYMFMYILLIVGAGIAAGLLFMR